MNKLLSILLLCSLPITTLANNPARKIGSAIIKLLEYEQYLGRSGRFWESKCNASHVLPLHANSENEHTIRLSDETTATVRIKTTSLHKALIAIKFCQKNLSASKPTITETTITHLNPFNLKDGRITEDLPSAVGLGCHYEEIDVRLTKDLNPEKE